MKFSKYKKKKIAIFDIDGTIFRKNLHFELLAKLTYLGIFKKSVRYELNEFFGHWLDHEGTYDAYRNRLVELYNENIKGCNQKDIIKAAKSVANFNSKRTYIYTRDLIKNLKKTHIMLVISGSPIEIVKEYSEMFGFDAYFGSVYEIDKEGVYTGKEVFIPVHDKGAVVKQFVAENNISLKDSFGIGDTESDAKMLELVDEPVAFNPNLNLKQIAEKNGWTIAVEKKDVLYKFCPEER